jgi:acyl-CoA reductase-like NAD-dependent aldehyde dehydrogenase
MPEIMCVSPIDGHVVATRQTASGGAVAAAVAAAKSAQVAWSKVPITERSAYVLRALAALEAMNADVVPELARQMGRPVRYGGEIRSLKERVLHMVGIAEAALAPVMPTEQAGIMRQIRREPLGVLLVVAPWNYPFLTAVNTIVPGLIAGNAVILKAASQTLLTGERFQQAFDTAGLPKGLFQNLVLTHDDTARLISGRHVNHVSFTGSVAGGQAIERAAAGTFLSVGLELGGKDPAYVRADANLEHAVENIVDGAFFNSGQSCCGIERVYVHASVYDRFVEAAVAAVKAYALDDPLTPTATLGPMAATRFAELVRSHTAEALAKGARACVDPKAFKRNAAGTAWLAPQLLVNVDHSMKVMSEETFGPVVGIMKVSDDAEAVRLMNDSPYGLTASIWTSDLSVAASLAQQIDTGTVFANRCDYLDPGLAWTGVKDTGRGATLSALGYHALTRPKSFHLRSV